MVDGVEEQSRFAGWRREVWLFMKAQLSAQIATVIDFLITILLVKLFGIYYLYATFIGSVVGGIVNCVINYEWVFKAEDCKKIHVGLKYFIVWGGSILINTWGTFALTEWLAGMKWVNGLLGYYVYDVFILSKITVALLVAFFWNYYLQRVFVYRNHNNMKMQELKEAVGVESRTTILNPTYIKEKMKGGASAASEVAQTVTNTYGWNVMKPAAIDKELWDNIYDVYVKDEYKLNVKDFFEKQNPAALQEVTAVMMETARKGYWKASPEQLSNIAKLHTDLVRQFGPSGSGFTGDNAKLQQFIASQVDAQTAANYNKELKQMKQATLDGEATKGGMVLKKQSSDAVQGAQEEQNSLNGGLIAGIVLVAFVVMLLILKKKRKK